MQKLGAVVRSNGIKCAAPIREEEVSVESVSKVPIEIILKQISNFEQSISEQLTVETIEGLLQHYQKAIEYFSAVNDEKFQEFLNKLNQLLQREDVQETLSNKPVIQRKSLSEKKIDLKEVKEASCEKLKIFEEEKQNANSQKREVKNFKQEDIKK